MPLSEFIRTNLERILAEFEAFARTIAPAETMDIAALRDHAAAILKVIALDLETPQTKREGSDKAKGRSDASGPSLNTPAQEHGAGRATSGFTFVEMLSEYRALRASVIRLWSEDAGELKARDLDDLVRFNEAIDQALAESTSRFTDDLDRTRETFLGILGHDLRSPLGAIVTSAQFMLAETELPPEAQKLTRTILSSSQRMNEMVADLLDFTRGRLGVGMPVTHKRLDLADVVNSAVEEIKASRPGAAIVLTAEGDLFGEWDSARLGQVLSNLLSNALHHGAAQGPITITAHGNDDEVIITVHNDGPPIPPDRIDRIFDPLTRHPTASQDTGHLGLGLYIAKQVVTAHHGTIEVDSSAERGTTFTVRLPRQARNQASPS